ncbi:ThiS family protein [Novipirellula aureliae]|uniref:Molybdopterin synthase sulfur carrier subunit n=1 Tax=Novipirellula aureliae TaxID=2527966 RepID=A0A5C6DND5_9BACT|nr:MoaD/ThiS family protein [Novipirellula aureliae]TWU37695.1 ThiS family protein [Novipirellula aureliae]
MKIDVLLFAAIRDLANQDSIEIEVSKDATAVDVLNAVGKHLPAIGPLLPSCRIALDSRYVGNDQVVADATEIALIPPVSGG